MSAFVDLRSLLDAWPHDPDDNVRIVRGEDGREIMQVRLPLGVEQHEIDGRPDGRRPHGMESALDYQLRRLAAAKAKGREELFELNSDACTELFDEGTLYYYRYLSLFRLKDWKRTLRDTARNLRLFDFVKRYAVREEDQVYLEKWRPYLVRMNAVAAVMLDLEQGHHDKALARVQTTIRRIEGLEALEDETFKFEQQRSILALRELAGQLEQTRPISRLERLERELRAAVEKQEFERAAQLRDRIRALRDADTAAG